MHARPYEAVPVRLSRWFATAVLTVFLTASAAAQPAQYTFATVSNMNHLPEFVGVEKGFFVKHGLDLKIKVLSTGSEVVRAFQSGEAQFIAQNPTTQAAAATNGIKLLAVCEIMGQPKQVYYDDMFTITARNGSGIRPGHLEDLAGKRVGLALASNEEEYLRAILAKANIPIEKVTMVNVPPPDHVSVMRQGGVDAESTWEPYGTMILDQVPGAYLVKRDGGYLGYSLWLGASVDYVSKNPDVMQKLVDAMAESEWYIRQHPKEAAEVATHWIEGLDAKSAEKALTYMNFDPRFGKNIIAAANLEQDYLIKNKRITGPVDFNATTTMTFVEHAMRQYPQYFKDLGPIK
jgi:sulfonate transport system substrate-binding protein